MPPSPEVIGTAGTAPDPPVSIITPSLNQAPFSRATIESVLAPPSTPYFLADLVLLNLIVTQQRRARAAVRAAIANAMAALCERVKRAVFRHAHTVHDDGWVERRAEFVLRAPFGCRAEA